MLDSPFGSFALQRYPFPGDPSHRAWDAADELILEYLGKQKLADKSPLLIFNDAFGALCSALGRFPLHSVSDSYCSHLAQRQNREANGLDPEIGMAQFDSLWKPVGEFDRVVLKVPRSLGLLEENLHRIATHLAPGTPIVAGGMLKNLSNGVFALFEKYFGEITTSLAAKKARLIFASVSSGKVPKNPYPHSMEVEGLGIILVNHGGTFSRDSLDPGSRFFLRNFPRLSDERLIVDLGCGNGLLSILAARRAPDAQMFLLDESYMAMASARQSFEANGLFHRGVFHTTNVLQGVDDNVADLVLCNPPFHFQNIQTREVALSMFQESKRVLKPMGQLWVVANNHLGYHVPLSKLFPHYTRVKKGERFEVFKADKTAPRD
jgi:23S rRNA (guanine1835-N2)-methyltransferase